LAHCWVRTASSWAAVSIPSATVFMPRLLATLTVASISTRWWWLVSARLTKERSILTVSTGSRCRLDSEE